jgi:outer membrane protein TolC
LVAIQQVSDNLASAQILAAEAGMRDAAVAQAARAANVALNEYREGTADYTTVVTAQIVELADREASLNIALSRLSTAVALIQSLGGGWHSSLLQLDPAAVSTAHQPALN